MATAIKGFSYGGKFYAEGEDVPVRPKHERILTAIGKIGDAPAKAKPAPEPAPVEEAPEVSDEEVQETFQSKRKYKRKDMEPES